MIASLDNIFIYKIILNSKISNSRIITNLIIIINYIFSIIDRQKEKID